jgi:hypothetical protein
MTAPCAWQHLDLLGQYRCMVCGRVIVDSPEVQAGLRLDDFMRPCMVVLIDATADSMAEPDVVDVAMGEAVSRLPIGDAVKAVAEATGLAAVARWVERHSGKDCGCEDRRAWLNAFGEYLAGAVIGSR